MGSCALYPVSSERDLKSLYLGRSIKEVPTPAAILDMAAAKRNCDRMLDACESLGLGWRAHIKTHKTAELTRLQVGDGSNEPAKIVISTVSEGEIVLPLLKEYMARGRPVNFLYGLPIAPGVIPRLAGIAKQLGPESISILLDDPAQLNHLDSFQAISNVVPHAYLKIDMGGRRAGVITGSKQFSALVDGALAAHNAGTIILSGLYSHAGHSYAGDSRTAAMKMLNAELSALLEGADTISKAAHDSDISNLPPLVLSAGASPTALSAQNLLPSENSNGDSNHIAEAASLASIFAAIRSHSHTIEIHAGVYPTLDLQQLAAHSLSSSRLSWRDIAFTILAEVHSVYPERGDNGRPEALIGAGGLALGREFCKAYPGFAILTPWGRTGAEMPACEVEDYVGWIVGRFAQEHGIVAWLDRGANSHGRAPAIGATPDDLTVGQKVRLWPNHACITGSHFGWYFVVDQSREGKEDEIVDIWVRARGW